MSKRFPEVYGDLADCEIQLPRMTLNASPANSASAIARRETGPLPNLLADTSRREARGAAALVAVLYRWSGQSDIPLSIKMPFDESEQVYRVCRAAVDGSVKYTDLLTAFTRFAESTNETEGELTAVSLSCYEQGARPEACSVHSDWNVELGFSENSVAISIAYDPATFEHAIIERVCEHLAAVLQQVDAQLDAELGALELLSAAEQQWLNAVCTGPESAAALVPAIRQFEKIVASSPDSTAVVWNESKLSYQELNQLAMSIATRIQLAGAKRGNRVIMCLDPGFDAPATLLATMLLGVVYVPVNPAFPQGRIDTLVEDTEPAVIVSQKRHAEFFSARSEPLIMLDAEPAEAAHKHQLRQAEDLSMSEPAYVYYTSGTTGKPKGVLGGHGALAHMLEVSRERYGLNSTDHMPAVASFTFSISMYELMAPLSVGATLHMLDRSRVLDPAAMVRQLAALTVFHIGPSLLKNIVSFIKQGSPGDFDLSKVRHASSGGDMVPPELLNDLRSIFTSAEVFVIYGCSEISLMGCTYQVTDEFIRKTYVGNVFTNGHLLLLDDDGNRVPQGAVGDVCLGGPGVVSGYLNRPEEAARLFFEQEGIRYYRTGDRGVLSAEGALELLGRRDFQVQVRGMRVELGEVEYQLRKCPGVRDGVVAATKTRAGETRLVGYFVADEDAAVNSEELRRHLLAELPDYMVPSFYMPLDALPLNQNMKIDRRALPPWQASHAESGTGVGDRAPRSDTERALASIWAEQLEVANIGLDDNFMLLGGDSIMAISMIDRVQRELGFKLDGMAVLRESLQVLGRYIDKHHGKEATADKKAAGLRRVRALETFYFGPDESLYGLLHSPAVSAARGSVLICNAIGNESNRCQYLLRLIAERLAAQGFSVLRFDYLGHGDSAGDQRMGTPDRWQADIQAAYEYLKMRTAAPVSVLGVRLGAALAQQALANHSVERFAFLDPIYDATGFLTVQRRMQDQKARKLLVIRNLRKPAALPGAQELGGYTYSNEALDQLQCLGTRAPSAGEIPCNVATTSGSEIVGETEIPVDCFWDNFAYITASISDKAIVDAMVQLFEAES